MRSMHAQADNPTKTGPVTPLDSAKAFWNFHRLHHGLHHKCTWNRLLNFSTHQVNTEASNDVSGVSCDVLLFCFSTTASI